MIHTLQMGQMGRSVASAGSGAASDPHWGSVSALLHMDGTHNSSTFVDSSSYATNPTVLGSARITTSDSKFGGAAGNFPGSNSYLRWDTNASRFAFEGDYTVEGWFKTGSHADRAMFGFTDGPGFAKLVLRMESQGTVRISWSGSASNFRSVATVPLNEWFHVAISRSGTTGRLFLNGVLENTYTEIQNYASAGVARLEIGTYSTNEMWIGNADEIRITKGVGRYTASFTPSAAAFPDS